MSATDVHVHLPVVSSEEGSVFLSRKMRTTPSFQCFRLFLKRETGEATNQSAMVWARETILSSMAVENVVVLALDGVYDANGELDLTQTHYQLDNSFVADFASACNDRALFGGSVNPHRKDALKVLRQVCDKGAALLKLVPSSQQIILTDPRHRGFWGAMAEEGLPLLCHVGIEHTIPPFDGDSEARNSIAVLAGLLANLRGWGIDLKVIAAHCALPLYLTEGLDNYHGLIQLFQDPAYKNMLYADLSALFYPMGSAFRRTLATEIATRRTLPPERLLLGSDFPVTAVLGSGNSFDTNVQALCNAGFDQCFLSNADKVLRLPKHAAIG